MIVIIKMIPAEYGRKLQGFRTAPQFKISWSDVVRLLTAINCGVQQLESYYGTILIVY